MYSTKKLRLILLMTVLSVTIAACASGPTSRSVEGEWEVSRNICSSNPKQPDLGDMRSEIRQKLVGISYERIITVGHLEKTILVLNSKISGRSYIGEMETYENSAENGVKGTRTLKNNREVNKNFEQAIEDFFKDDPTVNGEEAVSFCLFRGQ